MSTARTTPGNTSDKKGTTMTSSTPKAITIESLIAIAERYGADVEGFYVELHMHGVRESVGLMEDGFGDIAREQFEAQVAFFAGLAKEAEAHATRDITVEDLTAVARKHHEHFERQARGSGSVKVIPLTVTDSGVTWGLGPAAVDMPFYEDGAIVREREFDRQCRAAITLSRALAENSQLTWRLRASTSNIAVLRADLDGTPTPDDEGY